MHRHNCYITLLIKLDNKISRTNDVLSYTENRLFFNFSKQKMFLNFQLLNKYEKINYILVNIQLILGILGIVGNVLTICVFSRKLLRRYSYSFYWRIMALIEVIVLTETFKNWSNYVVYTNSSYPVLSRLLCMFGDYVTYCGGYISVWLHTIISVDRLIVIGYSNKFRVFQKRWFQLTLVLILVIYSTLLNIRMPLNYRLQSLISTSNMSKIICFKPQHIQKENGFLVGSNYVISHFVLNGLLDLKLIIAIRASKKKLYRYVYNMKWTIRDRKFAITSIVMNISSLLLIFPFTVGTLLSNYLSFNHDQRETIYLFTQLVALIDHSDLFLVNIFFNSIFFKEFRRMIKFR